MKTFSGLAARRAVRWGLHAPGLTIPLAHEAAKEIRKADSWRKNPPGKKLPTGPENFQTAERYLRPSQACRAALPCCNVPFEGDFRPWADKHFVRRRRAATARHTTALPPRKHHHPVRRYYDRRRRGKTVQAPALGDHAAAIARNLRIHKMIVDVAIEAFLPKA
jgi:hypothetical protein